MPGLIDSQALYFWLDIRRLQKTGANDLLGFTETQNAVERAESFVAINNLDYALMSAA